MAKRFLVLIALLTLGFFIAGCAEGDKSGTVTNPNPDVFAPTGSISGTVIDVCSGSLITGATVSVAYAGGVHKVVTDSTGAFSFNSVPAIGKQAAYSGAAPYYVTCSLPAPYSYARVKGAYVVYNDLGDGTNVTASYSAEGYDINANIESGSGASTPVTGLAANVIFQVAQPTASIKGTLYDLYDAADTGATVVNYPAAASIYLVDQDGNQVSTGKYTASTGAFAFSNVPALGDSNDTSCKYYIQIIAAGYDFADSDNIGTDVQTSCSGCGKVRLTCKIGCGATIDGVVINMVKNVAKDTVVPYIAQVDMVTKDGLTTVSKILNHDLIDDGVDPLTVGKFVITFDEAMAQYRRSGACDDPISFSSDFDVVVTSGGAIRILEDVDIIKSFTISMAANATTMSITPVLMTAADLANMPLAPADVNTGNFNYVPGVDPTIPWPGATVQILNKGSFSIGFEPRSPRLTDASLNPWVPASYHHDYYNHSANEVIQDQYILGTRHGHVDNVLDVYFKTDTIAPNWAVIGDVTPFITSIAGLTAPVIKTTFDSRTVLATDTTKDTVTPLASFVLNFNEPMNKLAFDPSAMSLTSDFSVLLTSAGAAGAGGTAANVNKAATIDILDYAAEEDATYDFAWNANGMIMTITPTFLDKANLGHLAFGWDAGATVASSVSFLAGWFELDITSGYGLFSQALNAWTIASQPTSILPFYNGTTYGSLIITQGELDDQVPGLDD